MKRIKDKRKYFLLIPVLFSLYIFLGDIIPFIKKKKVGKEFKKSFFHKRFLGKEVSVDRAALVETNQEAFDIRLAMFEEAKERIILSTFDIREGESTMDIFASLLKAADRGVKVQIIVDGFSGVFHMKGNQIFKAAGVHSNIEIKFYNIPNLFKPWRINGRLHDKYIMVDDKLLLLGGRNTFDYFIGEYPNKTVGYDREILIYNTAFGTELTKFSVISQVDEYFQKIWSHSSGKRVFHKSSANAEKVIDTIISLNRRYRRNHMQMPLVFSEDWEWEKRTVPINKATFISNPINILAKEPHIWYTLRQLMSEAKKRIVIHTPYVVLSKDMYEGLKEIGKQAADTVLLINSVAIGDNLIASSDYIRNRDKILDMGIQVYEYFGDHSSHGKSILIDEDISVIGSYNLDMRSTYVNTETILVIHGEEFNAMLNEKLTAFKRVSLKVNKDGSYVENSKIVQEKLPLCKQIFFGFSSRLLQLVRYLV